MKTIKLAVTVLLCSFATATFAQKKYYTSNEIPAKIRSYVKTNFSNSEIIYGKKKLEKGRTNYEVKLKDGTELKFDRGMRLTKMDSKNSLPSGLVPVKIRTYVQRNYPGNKITEWKLENGQQKVELNDDLELYFDRNGNFLRKDD